MIDQVNAFLNQVGGGSLPGGETGVLGNTLAEKVAKVIADYVFEVSVRDDQTATLEDLIRQANSSNIFNDLDFTEKMLANPDLRVVTMKF